jgi:hypothetical protein
MTRSEQQRWRLQCDGWATNRTSGRRHMKTHFPRVPAALSRASYVCRCPCFTKRLEHRPRELVYLNGRTE